MHNNSVKFSIFYSPASPYKMLGTDIPEDWQMWFQPLIYHMDTLCSPVPETTMWRRNKWKLRKIPKLVRKKNPQAYNKHFTLTQITNPKQSTVSVH